MLQSLSAQTRLLVVAPHPDDETLATGVLIQRVLAAGGAVHVLLLSDGDNNPWPQRWLERRVRIGAAERARWATRRRREFRAAMAVLGMRDGAFTALGWPDQGLTRRVQCKLAASLPALRAVLDAFDPDLVAMPALDDRHPDHAAAHVLMRLAMHGRGIVPATWLYRVHGGPREGGAGFALPSDAAMQARKRMALACHASQLALSASRMARLAARVERYLPLVAQCGRVPLPWHPPRLAWSWLMLTVADSTGGATWPWAAAPWVCSADGDYWLPSSPARSGEPRFAKLQGRLPSPWIFDHWGWCELPH
ncbi:PIG-L deacetylase family protein [Dyella sp. KRB-257]|uniref:PIG-L deacetylase family protein n=1 Tax=Dyella sp. KRB-257 TaxID=3400915 RepID=UPI003C037499